MQTTAPATTAAPAAAPEPSAETWAIVDLFGHTKVAGRLSEQQIGGSSFVRLDIPEVKSDSIHIAPHTRLFGAAAIYGITFVDQATATMAARDIRSEPVSMWSLKGALQQMPAHERMRFIGVDVGAPGGDQTVHVTALSPFNPED
ncbi:hypothetical protein [Methyloversatilis sp.]|uniref:hypothetical protein n=1 Tax=Methyloversatilis sp. TaxID=2569862 RepID=UPI002733870D|nr:hypothetical protein [Methyloversatilis sp.]MDP3579114.1 hypothetical protein [Methyloversatilis sp.]